MKAEDIVKQLMASLAPQTDLFTDQSSIVSITMAGNVATVNAPAHGFEVGKKDLFTITGAQTNMVIEEIVRVGDIASVRTADNHGLTFDRIELEVLKSRDKNATLKVSLDGSNETEFNGTFELVSVPNRTHFQFRVTDAGPVEATGSPVLIDGYAYGYNGTYNVDTVIDDDNFTFIMPFPDLPPAAGTMVLKRNYRISRIVNFERAQKAYTKQGQDNLWLFVELADAAASKDRHSQNDATTVLGKTNSFRQQVIEPFFVYCFANATTQVSGGGRKDQMREVRSYIFRSLLGKVFESDLACGTQNQVVFNSDGTASYDSATYAHVFQFETVEDISFGDSVGYDFNVPFRDVELGFDPVFDIDGE